MIRMTDPTIRGTVIAILATVLLTITGCSRPEHPARSDGRLDLADDLMESRPDSALTVLSSIDTTSLADDGEKARYALLMSMALDKNYIDTSNFDILQPAIDYYSTHGTPDEKLRTFYYQGRIFQNKGDRDNALRSFNKGIEISSHCNDSLCIARTLVARGAQFFDFSDYKNYINCHLRAAKIYKNLSRKWHEFDCLRNALNGTVSLKDKARADSILHIFEQFHDLDKDQERTYNGFILAYTNTFGNKSDIQNLIQRQERNCNLNTDGFLNLAFAYHQIGNDAKAKHILDSIHQTTDYNALKYLSISVSVYESLGDYKKALASYKEFSKKIESIDSIRYERKSKFIEEKHQLEIKADEETRQHAHIIICCIGGILFLLMVIIMLFLLFRSTKNQKDLAAEKAKTSALESERLKAESEKLELENRNLQLEKEKQALEAENLSHRVESLKSECTSLKKLIDSHEDLPSEVRQTIKVRFELLNDMMSRYLTDNNLYEDSVTPWIKELTDNTEDFMNSNRLAFKASHPRFIQYFEERGLTVGEINYVCLYAIGLKGKDVGKYLKKPSHVNISSAIRKKLGIDKHETNIGIYVRKLLKNCD